MAVGACEVSSPDDPVFARLPSSIAARCQPAARSGGHVKAVARRVLAAGMALAVAAQSQPAVAQAAPKLPLIRDAEIENLLRDYATPDLRGRRPQQGLDPDRHPGRPQLQRVRRRRPAHVHQHRRADGRQDAERDHRRDRARDPATSPAAIWRACASSSRPPRSWRWPACCWARAPWRAPRPRATGRQRRRRRGAASCWAAPDMAMRSLLSYQRSEEQAADRMAVSYLNATRQSPKGLLTTFQRFNQDAMFKTASIDPYLISHPLPADRIANLESTGQEEPLFRPEGPAGPAGAARHDARQAVRLFAATAGEVGAPLSRQRQLAARPLRPRHRRLPGQAADGGASARSTGCCASSPTIPISGS